MEDRNESDIIYIHCYAGVSRSASLVISYLMKKEQKTFVEAFYEVKLLRP